MRTAKLGLLLLLAGAACAGPSKQQRSDPANPPIMDDPEVAPVGEPTALRRMQPTTGDEEAVAIGGTQTPEAQGPAIAPAIAPSTSDAAPAHAATRSTPAATRSTPAATRATNGPRKAEAELKTVKGVSLDAEATLREVGNGVQITLMVEDAAPGKRGVHIHERGDCSDMAAKSMGEHFSPGQAAPHGLPTQREHHFGDLGNIQVERSGKGQLDIIVPGANLLEKDSRSLLGKAMVIREREDSGASSEGGAPIACAVIVPDD